MEKSSVLPNKIYNASCLPFMAENIADNTIDLINTDPPYGYSFMGHDWDTFNEVVEPKGSDQRQKGFKNLPRNKPTCMYENFLPVWKECLRVLKPGGFMFVMSAPRQDTLLEQIRAIKDAGFRVDFSSIYWAYASGFPKGGNISKMVDKRLGAEREVTGERKVSDIRGNNYSPGKENHKKMMFQTTKATSKQAKVLDGSYGGFQPKPAVEIIIVAMKPLTEKSYVDQAMKNGKGITWLDDCRIPYSDKEKTPKEWSGYSGGYGIKNPNKDYKGGANTQGRYPANLLVSDEVLNSIEKTNGSGSFSRYFDLDKWAVDKAVKESFPFLIVPKPSKKERNQGCEKLPEKQKWLNTGIIASEKVIVRNIHPTVKPLKLMSFLVTLGSRKGDIVLDPFCGSGSSCVAAQQLERKYIGIEKSEEYCEIANARLNAHRESLKEAA